MNNVYKIVLVNLMLFSSFLALNISVLADEDDGGVLCRNFQKETVWYTSGTQWGIGSYAPWYVFQYSTMTCCVNGTDMDGCDFSMENTLCGSEIVRAPRPENCNSPDE